MEQISRDLLRMLNFESVFRKIISMEEFDKQVFFKEDGKKAKKRLGCKEKKSWNVDSLQPCKTDLMKRNSFPCTLRRHRLANTCPQWILSIRKKCALRRMTLAAVEHWNSNSLILQMLARLKGLLNIFLCSCQWKYLDPQGAISASSETKIIYLNLIR